MPLLATRIIIRQELVNLFYQSKNNPDSQALSIKRAPHQPQWNNHAKRNPTINMMTLIIIIRGLMGDDDDVGDDSDDSPASRCVAFGSNLLLERRFSLRNPTLAHASPAPRPRRLCFFLGGGRGNPSIHQSVHQSIHQSICPSVHQSINPSVHHPSIHQSLGQSAHRSIGTAVHRSVRRCSGGVRTEDGDGRR